MPSPAVWTLYGAGLAGITDGGLIGVPICSTTETAQITPNSGFLRLQLQADKSGATHVGGIYRENGHLSKPNAKNAKDSKPGTIYLATADERKSDAGLIQEPVNPQQLRSSTSRMPKTRLTISYKKSIYTLSELRSPCVTKYFGSYLKGSDLWIIMKVFSGGSCGDLMKPGVIPEDDECSPGLQWPSKIADFGLSGQLTATMIKKNTFVRTPLWMAPEVIKQSGYDQKAVLNIYPIKVLFLIPKNLLSATGIGGERPTAKALLRHLFVRRAKKLPA
ncbi:Serine/threonine-protein kinase PAK 6 [Rhizina undulata]